MALSDLQRAIVETIAYFDVFDYPLGPLEISRSLMMNQPTTTADVVAELPDLVGRGILGTWSGLYGLADRSPADVTRRLDRGLIAEEKYRRLKKVGRWLAMMPFVRLIAVTNTLAYDNATADSDIDLFIVTARGRVWTARFFLLLFLKLLHLRPTAQRLRDRFCLAFFVDEDHLDVSPLPDSAERHLIYLVDQWYPVYDAGGVYARLRAANSWLKNFLPLTTPIIPHPRRTIILGRFARLVKRAGEWEVCLFICERWLERLQRWIMPRALREQIGTHPGVVVISGVIKLVDRASDARRADYAAKLQQRLAACNGVGAGRDLPLHPRL